MGNELTPEVLEKCKEAILTAKSADDVLALAKQNGIEMTAEKAEDLFSRYHKSGELSDDELGDVAGGGCYDQPVLCPRCGRKLELRWMGHYSLLYCPVCDDDKL